MEMGATTRRQKDIPLNTTWWETHANNPRRCTSSIKGPLRQPRLPALVISIATLVQLWQSLCSHRNGQLMGEFRVNK